jgi:hypothetical protein
MVNLLRRLGYPCRYSAQKKLSGFSKLHARLQLLNRFSLRQILGIVTLAAGTAAVLRHLRLDNGLASAFLLAPAIIYTSLRVTGIAFRPTQCLARRPGLVLGAGLLSFLAMVVAVEPRALIAVAPIAAFWMPQMVVAVMVETNVARNVNRNSPDVPFASSTGDQFFLACISGLLILTILSICLYGLNHHIIGKGTSFGKYWIVVGSGGTTEFQWQDDYSDIAWQWSNRAGRAVPAYKHRDWQFLGLARYRVGGTEKLRVPHWLPIGILLIYPVLWFLRKSTNANTVATLSRRTVAE